MTRLIQFMKQQCILSLLKKSANSTSGVFDFICVPSLKKLSSDFFEPRDMSWYSIISGVLFFQVMATDFLSSSIHHLGGFPQFRWTSLFHSRASQFRQPATESD